MATKDSYILGYRRKRQKKTDYKNRLNLLKCGKNRLVVRTSNKHVIVNLVSYKPEGDVVLAYACSKMLESLGWSGSTSNIPAAYLTGFLCGSMAKGEAAVFDIGLKPSIAASKLYAAVKGAEDGGIKVECNPDMYPPQDRLEGKHLSTDKTREFTKVKKAILSGEAGK
ncbi:MAG: 50S ribosomal protein L18 [Candidatus Altiarchaeales archaeon]|nr:50S ribosomal protein L18 [Candidatus Altiarchaeales archaeon]